MINSEIKEFELRRDYLNGGFVNTIYFGGGTPSVLKVYQVELLLKTIYEKFVVSDDCEITFECNPDDLTTEYLTGLRGIGVNRISIGVQSFDDEVLKFLGRRHSSEQSKKVIIESIETGFSNISIDLMFGIPGMSFESYRDTLLYAVNSGVQHISAYQLTVEKNTLLYKKLVNNKINEIDEDESIRLLGYTIDGLNEFGFKQYEISNYAKAGYESRHNSSYWNNVCYLGIGPSAHSYNGKSRQWNLSNSIAYCKGIEDGKGYFTIEVLTEVDQYNEYILTKLRTVQGISDNYVRINFNKDIYKHFIKNIKKIENEDFINFKDDIYTLKRKGIFILDFLVNSLYYI